jgi:NRAMP (natural resistance-associated macrophage protein)-like metal ion transporter
MTSRSRENTTHDSDASLLPHSKRRNRHKAGTRAQRKSPAPQKRTSPVKSFLKLLGPGFITGASDDDPSGIGTYSTAGASLGYATLWMALVSYPLMAAVQYICARIGIVSGMGLAGILKRYYPRWVLYPVVFALLAANTINAGADIGAIAAALNLLIPLPIWTMILPITLLILILQILGSYKLISNVFRWLTLALFSYILAAFFARPNFLDVLKGTLLPTIRFDSTFLATMVAILGTTISPYLFFWQTDEEVEEEGKPLHRSLWRRRQEVNQEVKKELRYAGWDVNIGMFFSNLVMYFIILTTAATLFQAGKHNIQSATEAAQALQPLAGHAAGLLLALGLIGSGFLAVPILTGSAAYALSEALGWKYGLDEKFWRAKQFYAIIIIATLIGMCMNFLGINPIAALFWTAVINGLLAPPLLVLVMLIANNRQVMDQNTNKGWLNVLGWFITVVMFASAIVFLLTLGKR